MISPLSTDPNKSEITCINHVRYEGVPSIIAARNTYKPTLNYFQHLKAIAKSLRHDK